jgi:hypothetical protein
MDRRVRKTLPDGRVLVAGRFGAVPDSLPSPAWDVYVEGGEEQRAVGAPLAWTIGLVLGHDESRAAWIDGLAAEIEAEYRTN